jgi:hypothetical protein
MYALTVITTIGYGVFVPSTVNGRCFTMGYAIVGFILLGYVMGETQHFIEAMIRMAIRIITCAPIRKCCRKRCERMKGVRTAKKLEREEKRRKRRMEKRGLKMHEMGPVVAEEAEEEVEEELEEEVEEEVEDQIAGRTKMKTAAEAAEEEGDWVEELVLVLVLTAILGFWLFEMSMYFEQHEPTVFKTEKDPLTGEIIDELGLGLPIGLASFYYSYITSMSIGFGDYSPETATQKMPMTYAMHYDSLMHSLMHSLIHSLIHSLTLIGTFGSSAHYYGAVFGTR